MKAHRFNSSYRKNSSKLHKKIGEILRNGKLFSGFLIYQEYPVNRVNPNYHSAAHMFDWVIPDLHLVIECHGEQHYQPVTFGGISKEEAEVKLVQQKKRDTEKEEAALFAGYTYIAVPYTDLKTVDENYLWELYTKNRNDDMPLIEHKEKEKKVNFFQDKAKERAKAYRAEAYKRKKEWVAKIKQGRSQDD
jgi:hypothetical protein